MSLDEIILSANDGNIDSQTLLAAVLSTGFHHESKTKVEINLPAALYYYCQAVGHGDVSAKWNAGLMFLEGEGTNPNPIIGIRLITEAAEAGNSSACSFLSNSYQKGLYDFDLNQDKALFWKQLEIESMPKTIDRPIDIENEYDITLEKPTYTKN